MYPTISGVERGNEKMESETEERQIDFECAGKQFTNKS